MNMTTISSWALLIAKALDDRGYSSEMLFRQVGLDPKMLYDPNARYPTDLLQKVWRAAVDLTEDNALGLKVASYWHPTTFHALGYSWMASGSLKEAMERAVRYSRVVTDVIRLHFDYVSGAYQLRFELPQLDKGPVPESSDAAAAVFVLMARLIYGKDLNPTLVTLPREKPKSIVEFSEFFQAPIEFEAPECSIFLFEDDVEKTLPTANTELAHANDKIVQDYLSHLDRTHVAMQLKSKMLDRLSSGSVTEQDMATMLNLSLRSLQRKLKDEGTSFKELLEDTRRELADQYIKNSRLSISEITFLLGFSEPSNFTRAFKRWNGLSPSEYRASL